MKLINRTAIISGASQGLGLEIAKQFAKEGAHVVICARSKDDLLAAQEIIQSSAAPHVKVLAQVTDIAQKNEVDELVAFAMQTLGHIDILVANAGVHGAKGPVDEVDWNEWAQAIDVNLKGTVLQCRAVLPHMKAQKYGKIMLLSGGGATKPMPYMSAYAASKAGLVRFAETLAEETKHMGIDVNAIAPGSLNTRLLDDVLDAGPEKVGQKMYDNLMQQKHDGGIPLETPVALCTFLASSVSDGITGRLLSAVWDPWQDLPKYADKIKNTDIYTLRRIIPEDRQMELEISE